MDHHNPLFPHRHIGGASYSIVAFEAHFPEWPLQVLDIRFVNLVKPIDFDQMHDTLESRPKLSGQVIKFLLDLFIQECDRLILTCKYTIIAISSIWVISVSLNDIAQVGQSRSLATVVRPGSHLADSLAIGRQSHHLD